MYNRDLIGLLTQQGQSKSSTEARSNNSGISTFVGKGLQKNIYVSYKVGRQVIARAPLGNQPLKVERLEFCDSL